MTTCWVIYDCGKVGTAHQCLGLAESLGLTPEIFEVKARFPWKYMIPSMWLAPLKGLIDQNGQKLSPPWPDIIIAAGRASVAPTAAIRRLTGGRTKVIQLQDPTISPKNFDLVVAPAHDRISGDKVIVTRGALHLLTTKKLQGAADKFRAQVKPLPKPLVAVLIGGTNRRYRLTPKVIHNMAQQLRIICEQDGAGLLIIPSRRTEPENRVALQTAFADLPAIVWDGQGDNPYMGFLALADYIVVTSDSVSMVSEACFTGKPVYIYHLPGGAAISTRFHSLFERLGYTRPLTTKLEPWTYEPLDEFAKVVEAVKKQVMS